MATNISISRFTYLKLNESQIYQWRHLTYDNLKKNMTFTKNDLLNYPIIAIPTYEELFNEIKEEFTEKIILGELSNINNTFIMIDSSSICNLLIIDILNDLIQQYEFLNKSNIILIYSQINKAENLYKKTNKYTGVNYTVLNENLNILNGTIKLDFPNLIILKTNLFLDNKILIEEEKAHLQKYGFWNKGSKNEINDDSQIKMINYLLDIFIKFKGIIVSHDRGLCNKIIKKTNSESNLFCKYYK